MGDERYPDVIVRNILGKKTNKRTSYDGQRGGYDRDRDDDNEEEEE